MPRILANLLIKIIFLVIITSSALLSSTSVYARPTNAFEQGLKAARSGQLDRAIKFWSKTIRKRPRCYAAYINRGTAHMQNGQIIKCINDWYRAKKVEPLFAFGVCPADYIPEPSSRPRLLGYAKSTELDPNHITSVVMTGIAYAELGYKKLAAELFRKCVDLTKNPMMKNNFDHWKTILEENFDD